MRGVMFTLFTQHDTTEMWQDNGKKGVIWGLAGEKFKTNYIGMKLQHTVSDSYVIMDWTFANFGTK